MRNPSLKIVAFLAYLVVLQSAHGDPPCSDLILIEQDFNDRHSIVDCASTTSDAKYHMEVYRTDQQAYFNPYDLESDPQVWECTVSLSLTQSCTKFVAWASKEHRLQICGGRQICHQCKWMMSLDDVFMDAEMCFAENKNGTGSEGGVEDLHNVGNLIPCYKWQAKPC